MNLLHPPRLRSLAREHALGTLTGGARRRFERLLHENAAARRELARWQEHFAVLAAAVPEMRPRERVWQGLQQRLGLAGLAGPVGPVGHAQGAVPSSAAAESWWQRWFGARALGGALAGALIALVGGGLLLQVNPGWIGHETLREELPASYVGLLSNSVGQPALLLSSRRHGHVLTAKLLQPLPAPAGRAAVLWAYPKGGAAPFAVGTLAAATGSAKLPLPDTSEKLFFNVERLGVSLETMGALPAAPSGDLVLSGPCVKLW
jgi:anti-sigma-K factor RskA